METSTANGDEEEKSKIQEEKEEALEDDTEAEIESSYFFNPTAMYVLSREKEKRKILCNVILTAIAFMLHYTTTLGTSILQSTINGREGLGVFSLATFQISSLCCRLFSPFVPRLLDPKSMMTITFLTVIPYVVAQLYPMFVTMIPAAVIHGLGSELLWAALYIYIFSQAWIYSQLSEVPVKVTSGNFFLLFFVISEWSSILSGIIPFVVLSLKGNPIMEDEMSKKNYCDQKYCPEYMEQIANLKRPSEESIKIIMYTFIACTVLAFIIGFVLIKSLAKYHDEGLLGRQQKHRIAKYLSNIVIFFKDCQHMLVLPLMLLFGIMRAFMIADLNRSFIACNHGISMVGLAQIAAGIAKLVATCLVGVFAKFNRHILFIFLISVNSIIIYFLLKRDGIGKNIAVIFAIVIVLNLLDSIWIVQLDKILPYVFHRQKFSALDASRYTQNWQNLSSAITYCISPFICTRIKLHLILGVMIVSTFGYILHCLMICMKAPRAQEESVPARSILPFM